MAEPALDDEDAPDLCANPDCRVAQDGRCVEGFAEKSACPQFGKIQIVPAQEAANTSAPANQGVPLPLAATLTVEEAQKILRAKESRVIAISGPFDSGKTSLIAGLYDLFQMGQVGRVAFSQSYSLHAFEQAAHDSRAASRRELPEMNRTPIGQVRFYHLDLVDIPSGAAPAVLLGDRAGEEYLGTRHNPDLAAEFPELRRADVLTMLVDGARLMDAGHRHNVRSEIRQTIQAFVEAGVVKPSQRLAVVLTKLDFVRQGEVASARALQDFDTLVTGIRTTFGAKFACIRPFAVAAQPKSAGAHRGEGLDGLLEYWMAEPLRHQPAAMALVVPQAERYFDRLQKLATEGVQ